jgi:hypothetical protein
MGPFGGLQAANTSRSEIGDKGPQTLLTISLQLSKDLLQKDFARIHKQEALFRREFFSFNLLFEKPMAQSK